MKLPLFVCVGLALVTAGQTASQPTTAPVSPELEAILDRLEARGDTINDLQTRLTYRQEDLVVDDSLTKSGQLLFRRDKPNARFAIVFEFPEAKRERYLFDGRWFTEVNERTKTYQRHEIVRPGESIDPFRIGQGPFPLPFGQKKADILANFEVRLVPSASGDPAGTVHLQCTPLPDTQLATKHNRLDFYVSQVGTTTDLPVRLIDHRKGQKRDTIDFADIRLNAGLPGSLFECPRPKASQGWQVFEDDTLAPLPDE